MSESSHDANVIGNHVLYKIGILNSGKLYYKARIVSHGNRDSEKDNLKTDFVMCPLTGVRMLLSMCAHRRWHLTKVGVKRIFCSLERRLVMYTRNSLRGGFQSHSI